MINLVIPVHSLTDRDSLKSFITKISKFHAQATDQVKKSKGISLHLPLLDNSESIKGTTFMEF